MADPVGLTASIISIATLAVQLGDALRKAAEFWEAVQDAPSHIRRLSKELRLVASVFHTIRVEYEAGSTPTNFESMVKDALELAKDDIDQLSDFISELSRNLSVANGSLGRQWRKVQMALKASKIERFRDNLESVKTTMALLQGSRQQVSLIQVNSKLDVLTANISSIATTSSSHQIALQTSQETTQSNFVPSGIWKGSRGSFSKSVNQQKTNFLLGTFNFRTTSTTYWYSDDDGTDDAENSTTTKTFLIEFLMGFTTCRKGFRFMTTSSFDRYTLDVVRRRSNDSEIFELCRDGSVQAVKMLLDRGEASIYDVDEEGESLLHKAVMNDNGQLCTMLLDLGADVYWKDDIGVFPIMRASTLTSFSAISEAGFELWPLFFTHLDSLSFSISIWRYMYQCKPTLSLQEGSPLFLLWSMEYSRDTEIVDFLIAWILEDIVALRKIPLFLSFAFINVMVNRSLSSWLSSLYTHWLNPDIGLTRTLNEYKLTTFLRQFVTSNLQNEFSTIKINDELCTTNIRSKYMSGVEYIIKFSGWNIEITNALIRKWTNFFVASGFDVISRTLEDDEESGDEESGDEESGDEESGDEESGDEESGDEESGDEESGDEESGDEESGDEESSNEESSNEEGVAQVRLKGHFIHCCRDVHFEIFREDQANDLSINITSATRPEFSHLDPMFLCETGRPRSDETSAGRCLSQVDESFIENGKFCMNVPGQWEEPLVPNSSMGLFFEPWGFNHPQVCYSMIHGPESSEYIPITEEDIQRIEEGCQNGTLYGLGEDST